MRRKQKIAIFCLAAFVSIPLLIYYVLDSCMGECITYKSDKMRMTLQILHEAVKMFKFDTGRYPTQEEGLQAWVWEPNNIENWPAGGYLYSNYVPLDSWHNPYIYIRDPNSGKPFEILSYGADGKPGGKGYDADLSSWGEDSE
jgi:general secretion pathway protein G